MVSILQEIDITRAFNHFAQKRCIVHQKRKVSSVCLHEDCWKLESDKAFFCEDCNVDHIKKHENYVRFNALFTDELIEECDEYTNNQNNNDKLKERIRRFQSKIDELHIEIEQWTRCQFSEWKKSFESHLIENLHIDYFQAIKNLKQMFLEAQKDLSLKYEFKENVKLYCTQIKKIQNDLNDVMNEQIIAETENKNDKMDKELDSKLQQIGNEIKENIKNQVNQFIENLTNFTKKSKSSKNELLMEEEPNLEISEIKMVEVLVPEIPMVKNH